MGIRKLACTWYVSWLIATTAKKITLSDNSVITVTLDGSFVAAALLALNAGQPDNNSDLMRKVFLDSHCVGRLEILRTSCPIFGVDQLLQNRMVPISTALREGVTVDTTANHYNLILAMKTKR